MYRLSHHLTYLRRLILKLSMLILVLFAIAITMARVFFPDLSIYKSQIESMASEAVGHSVRIQRFDARLVGIKPTFIFAGVTLVDESGKSILNFSEARVSLSVLSSLYHMEAVPDEVVLDGVNLSVTRDVKGTLHVAGRQFDEPSLGDARGQAASKKITDWLFSRSHLEVKHSTVVWRDQKRGKKELVFHDVNFQLRNSADRHLLSGYILPPDQHGSELKFSIDLTGDISKQTTWQGSFYAEAGYLPLQQWQSMTGFGNFAIESGNASFSAWGDFSQGQMLGLQGKVRLGAVKLESEKRKKAIALQHLETLFSVQRKDKSWLVKLDGLSVADRGTAWPVSHAVVEYQPSDNTAGWPLRAKINNVSLTELFSWLKRNEFPGEEGIKPLIELQPGGIIKELSLFASADLDLGKNFDMKINFENASVKAYKKFPGLSGVDGSVRLNRDQGKLVITGKNAKLNLPRLFRAPLESLSLSGEVNWFRKAGAIQVQSDDFEVSDKNIQTRNTLRLVIPGKPKEIHMDLVSEFSAEDAGEKSRYLPVGIMPEKLVDWLDASIRKGKVHRGKLVFNGRLGDFPYRNSDGRFLVEFDAQDVELGFLPNWPPVENGVIHARFTGTGMDIQVADGVIRENRIVQAQTRIADFKQSLLEVEMGTQGSTASVFDFLANSPIASDGKKFLQKIRYSGKADATLSMQVPISRRASKRYATHYSGRVKLTDGAFHLFDGKINATNLSGDIFYSDRGQSSKGLKGYVFGYPVALKVFSVPENGVNVTRISASGKAPLQMLAERLSLNGFEKNTSSLDWQGIYTFGYRQKKQKVPPQLRVTSVLGSDKIRLPEPLNPVDNKPIDLLFGLDVVSDDTFDLHFDFDSRIYSLWRVVTHGAQPRLQRGQIKFGEQASLPKDEVLEISGNPGQLALKKWLALIIPQDGIQKRRKLNQEANRLPVPIRMDVENLEILTSKDGPSRSGSIELEAVDIPQIDGEIRNFVYDKMHLGTVSVKTTRHFDGLRIEEVHLQSDTLDALITGRWTKTPAKQETTLYLKAKSGNIGALMDELGYAAILGEGKGEVDVSLFWSDALPSFTWANAVGAVSIDLQDGDIIDVKPGAGRLFGLLSLSALPRRLFLDFSDAFSKGFHFDKITGSWNIRDGNADTDDLVVNGTGAVIKVRGRTGLEKKDFDQQLEVIPGAADTVCGLGVLAVDPNTLLLCLMEKLFGSPIDKSFTRTYTITGSWENPVIERISTGDEPVGGTEEDDDV